MLACQSSVEPLHPDTDSSARPKPVRLVRWAAEISRFCSSSLAIFAGRCRLHRLTRSGSQSWFRLLLADVQLLLLWRNLAFFSESSAFFSQYPVGQCGVLFVPAIPQPVEAAM